MKTSSTSLEFRKVDLQELHIIEKIARSTWPHTFGTVMPDEQISYMLDLIYNKDSLKNQITEKNHVFLFAEIANLPVGYCSYELNFGGEPQLMLHKAYLLPSSQGKGIGKRLFDHLITIAVKNGQSKIRLKVFHLNTAAIRFYEKIGFQKIGQETVDIGKGYHILDNVMEKRI